ncbi:hypothetical protein JXA84_04565 [candidate division WOR-3 bacterium]|nr:hypothetical protein [candidate division WOR-3 bacterium]
MKFVMILGYVLLILGGVLSLFYFSAYLLSHLTYLTVCFNKWVMSEAPKYATDPILYLLGSFFWLFVAFTGMIMIMFQKICAMIQSGKINTHSQTIESEKKSEVEI